MTSLTAAGFPEDPVRARARSGAAGAFPDAAGYGHAVFGARPGPDPLDDLRLVPPVFMPRRMEKLIELGREPLFGDVALETEIGGFAAPLPLFLSAFGSTQVARAGLGEAAAAQAGRLGLPMVIGENVVATGGLGRAGQDGATRSLLARLRAYAGELPDGNGGFVVQQSTEDADAEVWNLVYSDPASGPLLESGRLGFELKTGQGAKPGLGGMTVLNRAEAAGLRDQFALHDLAAPGDAPASGPERGVLRSASPGTLTEEILHHQIRMMRNNFPRARVWVKLHPGRDVGRAAAVAWGAGAHAVTVDGAEGGSGWAPSGFLDHVGLPLAECLRRIDPGDSCLLVTGRMWEGARAVKALALGARAAGLGRAALLAVDEDPRAGLVRLVDCLALEMRMLVSALGKYRAAELDPADLWQPAHTGQEVTHSG